MEKLTEKQRDLIEAYLSAPDSTLAVLAKASGYKSAAAAKNALALPKVIDIIDQRRSTQIAIAQKKTDVEAANMIRTWVAAMEFDPLEAFDVLEGGKLKLKPLDEMPDNVRRAMIVEVGENLIVKGVKFADRMNASIQLAKYFHMFDERPEDEEDKAAPSGIVQTLMEQIRFASDEELAKFDKILNAIEVKISD